MPTISDVARRAGVSPATVSRVIQGAHNVHPATREQVERAIADLGYVPSAVAQSLRSKRTRSLALVVSDITNSFWTTIARGVEDVAQRHDYSVLLCNTDENLAKQLRYLDLLIGQQVDGVIIAPYDCDARHLDKLRQRNIPTVVIDRRIDGWDVDSVCGDSLSGARALAQHLIRLGHERIAMISGPATTSTAEERVTGYCLALAEAGLPLDPRLIKRGEYKIESGEEMTQQLLDEGLDPTAIFAGNNALAMGAINALEKRGLRIPHDIALVCFDDLPNVSHLFPFLTVVTQPVYDMGVNAAQLLLSRLSSEVSLRPRHVVLPVRLMVRHSCGSQLTAEGQYPLTLPISRNGLGPSVLVKPLSPEEQQSVSQHVVGAAAPVRSGSGWLSDHHKSDANRLLKALHFQEADRVPYLEFEVTSKAVYEYILERELEGNGTGTGPGRQAITPEDHVDFALRLGMDAVPCPFAWQPGNAAADDLEPPPSLAEQLSLLERYLRAAQGTGVGVMASFTSFFDNALLVAGAAGALARFHEARPRLEQLMDILLANQERAMRMVCGRFGADLALVVVKDRIAHGSGLRLEPETFLEVFVPRMRRLIAPAQEHGKLLLMHTLGKMDQALPLLHDIGFNAVHPMEPELNDLVAIKRQWAGKLALVGGISTALLAHGSLEEIEHQVRESCARLAPGGGYVVGSSNGITEDVPPQNLVVATRAVEKYGRYGSPRP
jgi:LacI family transcriptional regulator